MHPHSHISNDTPDTKQGVILKRQIRQKFLFSLGSIKKLHHPGTREGGVSEKMILDYVGGGRGIAKDDG